MLNIVGTTAIAAENLAGIQVLNGLTGALYGPQSPAGVFDYELKRPTQETLFRVIGSLNSQGIGTGQVDASATWGPIGYRFNIVHGQGEGYGLPGSIVYFSKPNILLPRAIVGSPGANTAYSGTPRTVLASLEFDL